MEMILSAKNYEETESGDITHNRISEEKFSTVMGTVVGKIKFPPSSNTLFMVAQLKLILTIAKL